MILKSFARINRRENWEECFDCLRLLVFTVEMKLDLYLIMRVRQIILYVYVIPYH